jgi:hypothetical protein
MRASKSPAAILATAYSIGLQALPLYAHKYSPKKYQQAQLFACLVFKESLQLDYRKLQQVLKDAAEFRGVLGMQEVPHYTTFQKAAKRLLRYPIARRLLRATLRVARQRHVLRVRIRLGALDATGFESHHVSTYYARRRRQGGARKQRVRCSHFPKLHLLCDTSTHLILAAVPEQGPSPDVSRFRHALDQARQNVRLEALAADPGYDSEANHRYARELCRIRTLIPAEIGRPSANPPTGYWRRKMKAHLKQSRYGQRWQAETVISMIKRLLGSALRARSYWSRFREMLLRAITHNIMILAEPP